MKKLLITGGAGFIGSNFVRYILDRYSDYRIINLDKLTYCGRRENLQDVEQNKNYEFVKGDITDETLVNRLVKDCDYILNFAAESHVDRSIEDPSSFVETNVRGVHVLLEAAKRYMSGLFIQISTDEVYGSIEKGSFREDSALAPNSPYSAHKTVKE